MERLLKCFEYLKPYHIDMLDNISIMLELFVLKLLREEKLKDLLSHPKEKIYSALCDEIKSVINQELYIAPNPKINFHKILKTIHQIELTNAIIEQFLHIITQKKTTNKLYFYSTPCEINQLLVGILDIKPKDEIYNPCYGMGSIFLSLANITPNVALYGEELDERISKIAKIIAKLSGITNTHLYVSDILANPIFRIKTEYRQFDKIFCNPPLNAHMGVEFLKDDERFSKVGILVKTYPELAFLTHSLTHLKTKGVFIVRNQTLLKSSLEGKLREKLCEDRMIEAIIELPKNIFPHQNHEFSLLVISHNNREILHIDASNEHFFTKDGKYNRIINVDEILHIYHNKSKTKYSTLTPIKNLKTQDLRAHTYVANKTTTPPNHSQTLESMNVQIFRGQRIAEGNDKSKTEFYDIGIADFAPYGFSTKFTTKKQCNNAHKIDKYKIFSYDILLSLRGVSPKLTIVGEIKQTCVANAGIIILRAPSKEVAIGLYCYLFSLRGEKALRQIYEDATEGSINTQNLLSLPIPNDYNHNTDAFIKKLDSACKKFYAIESEISKLKESY